MILEQNFYIAQATGGKEVFPMTGWTLFLIIVGVAFLTAQLFRLIDLIERPSHRSALCRKALPAAWNLLVRTALRRRFGEASWMFWRS